MRACCTTVCVGDENAVDIAQQVLLQTAGGMTDRERVEFHSSAPPANFGRLCVLTTTWELLWSPPCTEECSRSTAARHLEEVMTSVRDAYARAGLERAENEGGTNLEDFTIIGTEISGSTGWSARL